MAKHSFVGGVHPYDGKDISKKRSIKDVFSKGDMVYPVVQHIGAPAGPIVKKGDYVKRGQLIAAAGGFVSANIYSSVSGTVKSIEPRKTVTGDMVNSIIITNDEKYDEVEYEAVEDIDTLSKGEIIERIQRAGIVGMGGAGFPTHVKLSVKEPDKIDYCIANIRCLSLPCGYFVLSVLTIILWSSLTIALSFSIQSGLLSSTAHIPFL